LGCYTKRTLTQNSTNCLGNFYIILKPVRNQQHFFHCGSLYFVLGIFLVYPLNDSGVLSAGNHSTKAGNSSPITVDSLAEPVALKNHPYSAKKLFLFSLQESHYPRLLSPNFQPETATESLYY